MLHTGKWSLIGTEVEGWLSTAPVSSRKTDVASPYPLWCRSHSVASCCRKGKWCQKLGHLMWICSCLRVHWPSPGWPSSHRVVLFYFTQVKTGWLLGELLCDSAHSEHLPQPRQSPSLPDLLRQAHRSVEQRNFLCLESGTFSPHMFLMHYARLCEKYINL